MTKMKKCRECGHSKELSEFKILNKLFSKNAGGDTHSNVCKDCSAAKRQATMAEKARPHGSDLPAIPEGAAALTTGVSLGHQAHIDGEDVVVSQVNDGTVSTIWLSRGDLMRLAQWAAAQ